MVPVGDDERKRSSERPPVAEAGQHLDAVGLDLLTRTAPVSPLAPAQVGVDRVPVEHEPRGQPGHDRDQRRPVRLPGGRQLQRHRDNPSAARITAVGAGSPVHSSNAAAP